MSINNLNFVRNFTVLKAETNKTKENQKQITKQKIETIPNKRQMVNFQIALASYTLPKTKLSFKGHIIDRKPQMSDKEFEKIKQELNKKIKTLPKELQQETSFWMLTKDNINFAKTILFEEKFHNEGFISSAVLTLSCLPSIASINTPLSNKFLDKILSDKEALNSEAFIEMAGTLTGALDNEKKYIFLEKIMANPYLYKSKIFLSNMKSLIKAINNDEKIKLSEKIITDKNLYNNEKFMPYAGDVIQNAHNEYQIEIIAKILCNENLFNNELFLKNISSCLWGIDGYDKKVLVNKILADKNLYNNNNFMPYAGDVIKNSDNEYQIKTAASILCNENLFNNSAFMENAGNIVKSVNNSNSVTLFKKIVSDENNNNFVNLSSILKNVHSKENLELANRIFDKYNNIFYNIQGSDLNLLTKINSEKLDEDLGKIENQKKKILCNPGLYINGILKNDTEAEYKINEFFNDNLNSIMKLNNVFDLKTMEVLFRYRLNKADEYIKLTASYKEEDFELLKELSKSCNNKGEKFRDKEKIEFIHLISVYKNLNLDMSKMREMAKNGLVDVNKLNEVILNEIIKNCNFTNEEIEAISYDRLKKFDMKYIHLLPAQLNFNTIMTNDTSLKDLIHVVLSGNFKEYIHDSSNIYGKANANTQQMFQDNNLDYGKWLETKVENITFKEVDELTKSSEEIEKQMNKLMNGPIKGEIKKHFPHCVKDEQFIISEQNRTKGKLLDITLQILEKLGYTNKKGEILDGNEINKKSAYGRAKNNLNNPNKREMAVKTIETIKDLRDELENIKRISGIKQKNLDLTIKMWDRNPQSDIFQGNYSTCCIGINKVNGHAMAHYIMNSAFNMIEIQDNSTEYTDETGEKHKKTIGNALCYFIKDESDKPALVIDNIEISNDYKILTDKAGKNLRNAITQYAQNVAKEVSGNENISIYMSSRYNDLPINDLDREVSQQISFIGDVDCDSIYMDLYAKDGIWTDKSNLTGEQKLLKLV